MTAGGQLYIVRWHVPVKVMNLFCQDKTLLTRREGLSLTASNICTNGPVVWVVAVCVGVGMCFCIVLVDGREFSCHDEVVQMAKSR